MNYATPTSVPHTHTHVPCPFCGLVCDDLEVAVANDVATVTRNGCARSRREFALPASRDIQCHIDGTPVSAEAAIAQACAILRKARRPLFITAGADVACMRALLALADQRGALVDHLNAGLMRNVLALQDSGWITTTLTEIRNRADFILCVGTDVVTRFPRFFERCARGGGLFDDERAAPEIMFLGATPPVDVKAAHIDVAPENLAQTLAVLRALHAGKSPRSASPALIDLAQQAQRASYGVVVWAAADFVDPHSDLIVHTLCEWIKDLNRDTRAAGLALGGSQGDVTAHQVMTWQSGFPLRTRFTAAGARYDPHRQSWRRAVHDGEIDALLYVAEWDIDAPPNVDGVPTIVLGRAGMAVPPNSVFLPVGTPGLDRSGHVCRMDTVVTLPLRQLMNREILSAPVMLARILQGLS